MAIQSTDQLIAALDSGQPINLAKRAVLTTTKTTGDVYSLWWEGGIPIAGTVPTAGSQDIPFSTGTGGSPFTNPTGGKNTYIGKLEASGYFMDAITLHDRIWVGGFNGTITTLQSFADPFLNTTPANTLRLATGAGAQLWLEHYTATTATTTLTIIYTNQAGVTKTTTFTVTSASARQMASFPIPLATGDTGVRRVQSVQLTASTGAAVLAIVMLKPFGIIAERKQTKDAIACALERLSDNAAIGMHYQYVEVTASAVVPTFTGRMILMQG